MSTLIPIQYYELKKKHPDAVLLFRIGDFYETFGDDAIAISGILDLTLVRRRNGDKTSIELAGLPHHALDKYLPMLIRAGKRVAICEQLEDPKINKTNIVKSIEPEQISPDKQSKPSFETSVISSFTTLLQELCDVLNKLHTFEEIRLKTQEIQSLAASLGISPRRAFEECYEIKQSSLFEKCYECDG